MLKPFRQLLFHRTRGLSGPLFHPWTRSGRLVHGTGNAISNTGGTPPVTSNPIVQSFESFDRAMDGDLAVLASATENATHITAWPSSTPPPADSPTWRSLDTGTLEIPPGPEQVWIFAKNGNVVSPAFGPVAITSNNPQTPDFNSWGTNFPDKQWAWVNALSVGSWAVVEGELEITIAPGTQATMNTNSAPRFIQDLNNFPPRIPLEFRLKVRADAAWAAKSNYVMMGMFCGIESANKWLRMDYYNKGTTGAYYVNAYNDIGQILSENASAVGDKIIRLIIGANRRDIEVAFSHDDGVTWEQSASRVLLDPIASVGFYAGQESGNPGFTARFAYAELTAWPTVKGGGPWNTTDSITGNGTVQRFPTKASYVDGETFYALAVPAAGSKFVSWSDEWPYPGRFFRACSDLVLDPTFALVGAISISALTVTPGRTILDVSFNVSEPCSATLEYGLTTIYELGVIPDYEENTAKYFVAEDLPPGTQIFYRVRIFRDGAQQAESTGSATTSSAPALDGNITVDGGTGARALKRSSYLTTIRGTSLVANSDIVRAVLNGKAYPVCYGADTQRMDASNNWAFEKPRSILKPNEINTFRYYIIDAETNDQGEAEVTLTNAPEDTAPINRIIDFSTASDVHDIVQVVDGEWDLVAGGLQVATRGYDKIFAIMDSGTLPAYGALDVLVDMTVQDLRADLHLFGALFAFNGHAYDCDDTHAGCSSATCLPAKWWPHGFLPCIEWQAGEPKASVFQSVRYSTQNVIANSFTEGERYYVRLRLETTANGTPVARVQHWLNAGVEPGWEANSVWNLQEDIRRSGAIAIVCHHMRPVIHSIEITAGF